MSKDPNKNKRIFISSSYSDRNMSMRRKQMYESLRKMFDEHGSNPYSRITRRRKAEDC